MATTWVNGTTPVDATNLNALEDAVATAQSTADSSLSIVNFADAITIADDVNASVVYAYKVGRIGFILLRVSNTSNSVEIGTITNSAYRPYSMTFGLYTNLSAAYTSGIVYTRIQTSGIIQAVFSTSTSNSYLSFVYPLYQA